MYAAEGLAQELVWQEFVDDKDAMEAEQIPVLIDQVLSDGGWFGGHRPEIAFDVPDDSEVKAFHEGRTGVLHFHPRLLDRWTVLHELAHWCRPRDGHGPQFRAVLVGLVRSAYPGSGLDVELRQAFDDLGLDLDEGWS